MLYKNIPTSESGREQLLVQVLGRVLRWVLSWDLGFSCLPTSVWEIKLGGKMGAVFGLWNGGGWQGGEQGKTWWGTEGRPWWTLNIETPRGEKLLIYSHFWAVTSRLGSAAELFSSFHLVPERITTHQKGHRGNCEMRFSQFGIWCWVCLLQLQLVAANWVLFW